MKEQLNARLRHISRLLEAEKPIILYNDADERYFLVLKGLSEATLDRDSGDPEHTAYLQNRAAEYLRTIQDITPFLVRSGLMHENGMPTAFHENGRQISVLRMPGGQQTIDMLSDLYREQGVDNPFTIITNVVDSGLIDTIMDVQQIGRKQARGR